MPVHDATQITEHCPGGLRACCLSDVLDESRDIEPFDFIDLLLAHTGRDVPQVSGSQIGRLAVLVYDGSEGVFSAPSTFLRSPSGSRPLATWP